MQKVLEHLSEKGVYYKISNKGYSLEITESFRRDQLIAFMHSRLQIMGSYNFSSGLDVWISKQLEFHKTVDNLIPIILDWQTECRISIDGVQLDQLLWVVSVIIMRFNNRYILKNFPSLHKAKNFYLAANLMKKLDILLKGSFTKAEVNFLATYLDGLRLISENNSIIGNVPLDMVFQPFLMNISKQINLNLSNDHILIANLISHTKRSLSVLISDSSCEILMLNELKNEYQKLYQAICDNIYILEHSFRFLYNDKEIMYLMLHLVAAINRKLQLDNEIRFLIVCDSRISVCTYLKETISYYYNASSVETISSYNLFEYLNDTDLQPDIIIATNPIKIENTPVVYISVPLQLNDIIHIQEEIFSIKKFSTHTLHSKDEISSEVNCFNTKPTCKINTVIKNNLIQLDVDTLCWESSIRYGANILYEAGLVCRNFVDALLKNIEKNGPYFVFWKGVALSHTATDFNSSESAIAASFIRLKTPVYSGHEKNDPVKYIITLSEFDTEKYYNEFSRIISFCSNREVFFNSIKQILLAKPIISLKTSNNKFIK